jgi:eukaryotic-like serine/threonine-protein kinase
VHLIDDRYELLEVIASGGMATVWRARDTRLNRLVAVKRPHPSAPGDPSTDRLSREARAAASLSHPHLVTVYDYGNDESGPYLVMELVEGPTLQDVAGDLSVTQTVETGASLADALAAIHAVGIVHRDVKPGNVIMSDRGPLLTDFGIAQVPDATSKLTQPGEVLATPAYAAPEVLAGGESTPASDVYSLAMTVDELIRRSGSAPDAHVGAVLGRAMSPSAADRPDAAELAAAIRQNAPTMTGLGAGDSTLVLAPAVPAPPDPEPDAAERRVSPALLATGLLAVLAIALILIGLTQADPELSADAAAPSVVTTTVAVASTTTPAPTSTLAAPTTSAAPTTTPSSADQTRDELEALLMDAPRSDLNPPEVRDMMKKVDEAIAAAASDDDRKAEQKLSEVAKKVDDKLAGDTRDEAVALLEDLADQLEVDLDAPPEERGRGDDDDD